MSDASVVAVIPQWDDNGTVTYWRVVAIREGETGAEAVKSEHVYGGPDHALRAAVHLYYDTGADHIALSANEGGNFAQSIVQNIDPTVGVRVLARTRAGQNERDLAFYAKPRCDAGHVLAWGCACNGH